MMRLTTILITMLLLTASCEISNNQPIESAASDHSKPTDVPKDSQDNSQVAEQKDSTQSSHWQTEPIPPEKLDPIERKFEVPKFSPFAGGNWLAIEMLSGATL